MSENLYHFDHDGLGSNAVDTDKGIIRGVSVITNGVTARGHNLEVDDKTLEQLLECALNKGKVPVKYNHGSGVENVGGYLFNFRIDGKKLRADWQLMRAHKETTATLEKAKEMPECFGLSAAFMGKEEAKGGKKYARCTELIAVDCVAQPAANPDGVFGAKVDTHRESMADQPSLEEKLTLFMAAQEKRQAELEEAISGIQEFNTHLFNTLSEEEDEEDEDAEDEDEDEDEEGEPYGEAAEGAEASELSALKQALVLLEAKAKNTLKAEKEAATEQAFSEVEQKIIALAELNAELEAENEALQLAVKSGNGTSASPSRESKLRMFDARTGGKNDFEARVTELCAEGKTRGQATELARRENPESYTEHLRSIGAIK